MAQVRERVHLLEQQVKWHETQQQQQQAHIPMGQGTNALNLQTLLPNTFIRSATDGWILQRSQLQVMPMQHKEKLKSLQEQHEVETILHSKFK
jgi:hypothetical protein